MCGPVEQARAGPRRQRARSHTRVSRVRVCAPSPGVWCSGEGPDVGVYKCDGGANQAWQLPTTPPGPITSLTPGGPRCLSTSGAAANGAQFIIDETGVGQLSLFGSNPTDHCISACL